MTRAEAIKMLNRLLLYCDDCPHGDCEKCVEAINMAEDALEQQTCDNCKFNEETDGMNCYECLKGMNDNFEALEQEPSRATGKWIPVSERLPSESDYYLATLKSSFETEVAIIWFAHIDDYGSKSEWREITDDDTVVAWMPLPEPYKESAECNLIEI